MPIQGHRHLERDVGQALVKGTAKPSYDTIGLLTTKPEFDLDASVTQLL